MLPRQQALWCLRNRNSFVSLLTGLSIFSGTDIACLPESSPCGVCGVATRLRPCQQALRTFQGRTSHASLAAGPAVFAEQLLWYTYLRAAEMRLGCENELSMQIGVWAAITVLAAKWRSNLFENRPFGLSGSAYLRLHLQTGSVEYAGPQSLCVPANWPYGLFGHGHRMLSRQQALRCLRAQHSCASLLTCPSVFSGTGIACFPDSRPCGLCGDANRLRPCKTALRSFRVRASHDSPITGPAEFAGPQLICVPANRPFGLFVHGHRMLLGQQALRCFRGRKSIASLQIGPSVFSGIGIACFHDNRPCGVGGPAIRLRPC